ncbi:MAG: hypothetical protein R3E68_13525 [Burkholderiaceae bacterium]
MDLGFHGDTLLHRDRTFEMVDQPLEQYFELIGTRPEFEIASAVGRGYTAQWMIEDGWLFLVNMQARWSDAETLSLTHLFPFAGSKVFAAWFNGSLRAYRRDKPLPDLSQADRQPYPDLTLTIEHGRIASSTLIHRASTVSSSVRPAATLDNDSAEVIELASYRRSSVHAAWNEVMV